MPSSLFVLMTAVGAAGTLGQIMVLRELLVLLHGQELSTGLVLASWLGWTACGGFLTVRWGRRPLPAAYGMTAGLSALALLLPITILWIRATRMIWGLHPGESLDLWLTPAVVLTATGPFCLTNGGLFATVWMSGARGTAEGAGAPPLAVYLAEALGAAGGGLLFTFVLLPHSSVLTASLLASIGLLVAGIARALMERRNGSTRDYSHESEPVALPSAGENGALDESIHSPARRLPPSSRNPAVLAALFLPLTLVLGALAAHRPLEEASRRVQWGAGLRAVRDTPFHNLALLEREGQFTLFANGLWAFSAPDPQSAEEAVHTPLLMHPNPRHVLLMGGVTGGPVGEILKHPSVEALDGVEPDPEIVRLGEMVLPPEIQAPLHDARVHLLTVDAGRWVRTATSLYDVILLNVGEPLNIGTNRFYTVEFFRRLRRLLHADGLLSFTVPYAPDVLGPAQVRFLQSLRATLEAVFPAVVVAGGSQVRFFASPDSGILRTGVDELAERLVARNLGARLQYIREDSLWDAFNPFRLESLKSLLADDAGGVRTPVNTDREPVSAFHSLQVWSVSLHPALALLLERVATVRTLLLGTGWFFLGAIALWGFRANRAGIGPSVKLAVAVNGGTLMVAEIMLFLGFQTLEGYVYRELALIVSAFMAGMALGAAAVSRVRAEGEGCLLKLLVGCQVLLAGLIAVIPVGLSLYENETAWSGSEPGTVTGVFCLAALFAGALGGGHFALAVRIMTPGGPAGRGSGPILYGWDLLGAAAGAVLGSVFLLPLFGLPATSWNMAALNGLAALLLVEGGRHGRC